jgi:hypothetical protein
MLVQCSVPPEGTGKRVQQQEAVGARLIYIEAAFNGFQAPFAAT